MSYNMFEGELVRLRGVAPDDWEVFHALDLDSEAQRYGWMVHMPRGLEGAKKWAHDKSIQDPDGDNVYLAIETRAGNVVGSLNTHACDRLNRRFEYGIALGREHWGNGYAEDAIRILCRFMFFERGYHKVAAWVYAFNARSVRMHEKFGMVKEGLSRESHFTNGSFHDEILFGMTVDEFAARHGSR